MVQCCTILLLLVSYFSIGAGQIFKSVSYIGHHYNCSLISSSVTNPRHLWKNINKILHRSSLPALLTYDSLNTLSHSFAKFFSDKIHKLHTSLLSNHTSTSPHIPPRSFTLALLVSLPLHL